MYCKNCGSKVEDGAKLCSVCGARQEGYNQYQPPYQTGYSYQKPLIERLRSKILNKNFDLTTANPATPSPMQTHVHTPETTQPPIPTPEVTVTPEPVYESDYLISMIVTDKISLL